MKPMLVFPPAPGRWPALQELLSHKGPPWITDIERRVTRGVAGAQDVYAVVPSAGRLLAGACINKWGDIGVLGHCFTRPECRRRGYARQLIEALLSWFDMSGGRWLLLGTTLDLAAGLYAKFGFELLRRAPWTPHDRVTMLRRPAGSATGSFPDASGDLSVRDLSRAEWPAMVSLLQYFPGPDPRVPIEESAVTAELFTLDLIEHLERGRCQLQGAFQGARLVGLGSVATDREGPRTHAILIPHTGFPPQLRSELVAFAASKGYKQVDFPMECLR